VPQNYTKNCVHLRSPSSNIESSDFCETNIIFEVDAEALQPFMETLAGRWDSSGLDHSFDGLIIDPQLDDVLKKDPQEIGCHIPAFLLHWFFCRGNFSSVFLEALLERRGL
jgi:hypothetical protein